MIKDLRGFFHAKFPVRRPVVKINLLFDGIFQRTWWSPPPPDHRPFTRRWKQYGQINGVLRCACVSWPWISDGIRSWKNKKGNPNFVIVQSNSSYMADLKVMSLWQFHHRPINDDTINTSAKWNTWKCSVGPYVPMKSGTKGATAQWTLGMKEKWMK